MLKASLSPRRIVAGFIMVGLVASALSLMPTHGARNTLAETCANPPTTPTLNYWPVTYTDDNTPFCHDFPAIDAAIDNQNPQFSQNEADWQNGLHLDAGQQGVALMYIHNGAANNLDPEQTTARDVKITTRAETGPGSSHKISVTFSGSNTNTVNKSFTIYTPENARLEVIPNSGFMYNYLGQLILDQQNLNLGNSTYNLGDLDACFEYSVFLSFKFKVVADTPPSTQTNLSVQKLVSNTTAGTGFTDQVSANKGEKLKYQIKVKNTGNVVAKDVQVTDNGASGITIDSTSVNISGASQLFQGIIPGTILLGDLQPGQEVVITYTATATSNNCATVNNTATVVATNATTVSDTASVNIHCEQTTPKQITINKQVRKSGESSTNFVESVSAKAGDSVRFRVTVTNTSNTKVDNVRMTDVIPSGLKFADNVTVNGSHGNIDFSNNTLTINLGSLERGESRVIEFSSDVLATSASTICNTASAVATDVSQVQDNACVQVSGVIVNPGSPSLVLSKRAWNDTKNIDANNSTANRNDYITYSLITMNNGTADQVGYIIKDDLSQVLPLADIVATNGGTISGNTISYPAVTIKPGETIVKTFRVKVKSSLDKNLTYQLKNTYGNTVMITVPGEKVYEAPKTGAAGTTAAGFAGLVTAGIVALRNRRWLYSQIFNS